MKNKGYFIVFDGSDGSGKSTQAKLIYNYLKRKNYNVTLTREPGGTEISEKIREIILSPNSKMSFLTELLLYEAARAQIVDEIIKPKLNNGEIVICDRFTFSTIAYQGFGRGISIKLIEKLNSIATSGLKPDLAFIFDINVEEGLRRVKKAGKKYDRLERENLYFHKRVRKGFLEIAKKSNDIYLIKVLSKSKEEIFNQILSIIIKKFHK